MTDEGGKKTLRALGPRWPWLRAFGLITAVFVCGLVVGVVSTSTFLWHRAFDPFRQPPGFAVERLMNDVRDELLLSPEQSEQLKQVFAAHYERMKVVRNEIDPKIQSELDSLETQVVAVLRPEQAQRWKVRYEDMKKRFMNPQTPGGPPGPGRGPHPPGQDGPPGPPPEGAEQGPVDRPRPPGFQPGGPMPGPPGVNGPRRGQMQPPYPGQPPEGNGQGPPGHPRPPGFEPGGSPPGPPPGMEGRRPGQQPRPERPGPPPQGMEQRPDGPPPPPPQTPGAPPPGPPPGNADAI